MACSSVCVPSWRAPDTCNMVLEQSEYTCIPQFPSLSAFVTAYKFFFVRVDLHGERFVHVLFPLQKFADVILVVRYLCPPRRAIHHNRSQSNDIGDEYHYLFICPFFKSSRDKYIPKKCIRNLSVLKFCEIMNGKNTSLLNRIAKFAGLICKHFF